ELLQNLRPRTDENDAGALAGSSQQRVLGQKSVTRMDRMDFIAQSQLHNRVDVEIGADWFARFADRIRLVRFEAMQGEAVFMRIHGDRADAELVSGSEDANGNLTAVRSQDFTDRLDWVFRHRWTRASGAFRIACILEKGSELPTRKRWLDEKICN